ncbi:MAG: hypothetical protein FJX67_00490 [Alphaproteobacteria bacterium]|nr:hypothetical protein [Alphaproteobacteria bacterium]
MNLAWVLKIVLICFVVGLVLAFFGIDAVEFWKGIVAMVRDGWDRIAEIGIKIGSYVLLGAAIVLPVLAVIRLFRWLKRR